MHSRKPWPCDDVKDILSRFLNMLQCSARLGLEIADWKNVEMCFAEDIPQQQPGDTFNCGIFVLLMMELIANNVDMCYDKFPFSIQDMDLVRRRLILNIKKFNTPRILYHEPSGGKDDSSAPVPPVASGTGSVPGCGRGRDSDSQSSGPGSRSGEKYSLAPQRSAGPALISKPDLGYNSQSSYPYQSSGGQSSGGKSSYNSYSGASQSYERQSSSGYSGTNGLSSNYGGGSGSSSSYNNASQAGSGYPSTNSGFNSSQQGNNFGSSYGAATTAGAGYSSFSSQNSYSGKTGGSSSQTSNTSYLPTTSALSSYSNSGPDSSSLTSTVASSKSSAYASTETVSASSSSLGLSSATNSSKMSVNTTQGNKLVPGMPPGVAGVLPAQYMTPAGRMKCYYNLPTDNNCVSVPGFPAAYLAGLGQPAAAMYGYGGVGGHQLEDLAALQRSTLAASLPQLVGSSAGGQPGGSQVPGAKGVSYDTY